MMFLTPVGTVHDRAVEPQVANERLVDVSVGVTAGGTAPAPAAPKKLATPTAAKARTKASFRGEETT